jgi:hypothetical protein
MRDLGCVGFEVCGRKSKWASCQLAVIYPQNNDMNILREQMIKSKLCAKRDEIDETKHNSFSLLITMKFEATSTSTETEPLKDYHSLTMLILPSNEVRASSEPAMPAWVS